MNTTLFEKTVFQTVEGAKIKALDEYKLLLQRESEAAVNEAITQAREEIDAERYKIELVKNKEAAAAFNYSKRMLIELRVQLTDALFNNVKEDLLIFTETPDYPIYLQNKLSASNNGLFAYIQLMERDKEKIQTDLSVEISEEDFIGGFKLISEDRRLLADYTLLAAWYEQRTHFPEIYNEVNE
jgi:vacuolar-type H+-ATPase subunit E/Vma4